MLREQGSGGGFNERVELLYTRHEEDDEYDQFGRKLKKKRASTDSEAAPADPAALDHDAAPDPGGGGPGSYVVSAVDEDDDDEEDEDEDEDTSKYDLFDDGDDEDGAMGMFPTSFGSSSANLPSAGAAGQWQSSRHRSRICTHMY